ncbi:CCC motif membrane protein [uncultured Tenacibaculum sp.]|uniref:CCC motif membrane protein n=1 Tax=uncultured Tenacibaculum sp. TaxID=174713 RepID=UPI00262FD198|nr:CCC motif membrane protein [uncultured Tenacibaculum sp.]
MFELEERTLPNANVVLILGILSILGCCCYGLPGILLGVVALILHKKDKDLYLANPSIYTNYSNLNAGFIMAIIGVVLSFIFILMIVWAISTIGLETLQDPELMRELME